MGIRNLSIKSPQFDQAKVLVIGDVMLDSYWFGSASRISPEAPVPVVHVKHQENRPGGAANVALNISTLGADVSLLGLTGDDEAADNLNDCLNQFRVACHFVKVKDHPTVNKLRVMSKNQQLMRLDFETGFAGDYSDLIEKQCARLIGAHNFMVLSDYGKGSLSNCVELIRLGKQHGVEVLVDPKGTDFSRYQGAMMITPNLSEFEAVVGHCRDEEALLSRAHQLIDSLNIRYLLVTRSEKGMTLVTHDSAVNSVPARAQEVYDVTGAGDTVIATMAASLACGMSVDEAMQYANLAAGVVVGKLGTATVTIDEIDQVHTNRSGTAAKILTRSGFLDQVAKAKHKGERVVMTNGCFDILHRGHIAYLEQAKALGSRLAVAVNSDESVRLLKGDDRPLNSLEDRMALLAALDFVDWVVPFNSQTPKDLICAARPDVLVKGGDYKAEDIAGYDCVSANGGDVVILEFLSGKSSTELINRIKNKP